MTVFDWEEIRPKFQKQATRDATIKMAFQQYIEGNSEFENMCTSDLNLTFDGFRAAWIICEHIIGG